MKYRDKSEARKLLTACGEYGQLKGEVGKGSAHIDGLRAGKAGSKSMSFIRPAHSDPEHEYYKEEKTSEAE